MPQLLELSPAEAEVLREYLPELERIGFALIPFGGQTYQIQAVPSELAEAEAASLVREFVGRKRDGDLGSVPHDRQGDIAARLACKVKNIKAGQTLTAPAREALVRALLACQVPFSCPHGRPTMIKLTAHELDRQFDRK
jgi:DNA mismatch repair protein MutL